MKRTLIFSLASLLVLTTLSSSVGKIRSKYYPMIEGTYYEITSYDKKGEITMLTTNEVIKFENKVDGTQVATVKATVANMKKDGEKNESNYNIIFDGTQVEVDVKSLTQNTLNNSMGESDANIEVSGTNMYLPNSLKEGDKLPDTKINMEISTESMNMNFHFYTLNRTVGPREEVTTPTGTYNCITVTYDTEVKTIGTKNGKGKIWLAEGFGVVKEEEYNKKGKLQSWKELTKFD